MTSQKQETFEGIDFEEIKEVTSLETDEIKVLKICFNMFDTKDQGFLSADDLDDILRGMGFRPSKEELADILEERGSTLAGVAEGVATAPAALRLARSHGVDVPLIAAVCAVLRGAEPSDALATLLLHPVRANGDLVVPE